jgi:rubrerythrin
VELNIAKKIKHTPDIYKMREFHKLGLGNGMGERSIFWTCSNCELWVSLAYKFCPNCGAKFESGQTLEEHVSNTE